MATSKQTTNQGNRGNQDDSSRGFGGMDPERQREIAAEGGRASHASGNAHEFTPDEAREAGSKSHGGQGGSQGGSQGGKASGGSQGSNQGSGSTRGGTPEQHAEAGRQSHKNDKT